jgi:hypothetical protein
VCTVSVVPHCRGLRVACNRDERRSRPDALPPIAHVAGGLVGLWPVDPASGGTWIGVNEAGLVAAILNSTPVAPPPPQPAPLSRGTIVPAVLQEEQLAAAISRARAFPDDRFEPYVLVLAQAGVLAVMTAGGSRTLAIAPLTQPTVFTSSSLGDHRVQGVRRALFAGLIGRCSHPLEAQARFHRHQWRRAPELSVLMTRPDARTVSRTIIDASPSSIRIRYCPLP